MEKTIEYKKEKETKGAVVYSPVEEATGFGNIYLRKEILTKPYPTGMTIVAKMEVK